MTMGSPLMHETVWFDRLQTEEAEYRFHEHLANQKSGSSNPATKSSTLVNEIARARENIQSSLSTNVGVKSSSSDEVTSRIKALEKENQDLQKVTSELKTLVSQLQARVASLEEAAGVKAAPALHKPPPPSKQKGEDEVDEDSDSDSDDDMFGDSDEGSSSKAAELKKKIQEDAKKKKKQVIAKSNIILDVKPFSDETDMKAIESNVREIAQDGLLWGASKLVEVAFGIKKLQISCVVEDEKVSIDDLQEKIEAFEDLVQSVDIAAFNKI